jgi:transcription antitermination factor NusG
MATGNMVTTPGVVRIVCFAGSPIPIEECEIDRIMAMCESPGIVEPWTKAVVGAQVRIENGPLRGLEGVLVGEGNARSLVVTVTLLQRSVAAVLDPDTCVSLVSHAH